MLAYPTGTKRQPIGCRLYVLLMGGYVVVGAAGFGNDP